MISSGAHRHFVLLSIYVNNAPYSLLNFRVCLLLFAVHSSQHIDNYLHETEKKQRKINKY